MCVYTVCLQARIKQVQYIHNCTSHLSLYQNSRQACGVWQMDLNKIIFLELRVKSVKLISMCRWLCLFDPAETTLKILNVQLQQRQISLNQVLCMSLIFSHILIYFFIFSTVKRQVVIPFWAHSQSTIQTLEHPTMLQRS